MFIETACMKALVLFASRSFALLACCIAVAAASAESADPAARAPVMFRGGPAHLGSSAGPAIDLAGMAWRFATGGPVRSAPAVTDGVAIFGSGDGSLYAVELKTGRQKWHVSLGGEVTSSPAIAGGRVIVMAADGTLHARRLEDGTPVWSCPTGPSVPFEGDPRAFDLWASSPTIVEGVIYVGSGDGKVYAVDLQTGQPRWSRATRHRVRSTPAVVDGSVYVGSFDGHLYALDAATGEERWKFQTGDAVQSSPAVADGVVVFGSRSMAVFALEAKTGALKWRRPHSGSWVLASPAIAGGKVVIGGSDSHLLEALDLQTGRVEWSRYTGGRMLGSPIIVGGIVAYGGEDFRVYTIDLASGLGRSIDFTEGALYGSIVLAGDLLLVGGEDRHLYAFATRPAEPMVSSADREVMQAATGHYRTESGDEYLLSVQMDRLAVTYATYPPALAVMQKDGSFACPMLWGTTGRLEREQGEPARALLLSQFGQNVVARRVEQN